LNCPRSESAEYRGLFFRELNERSGHFLTALERTGARATTARDKARHGIVFG
jgi:hypothetical protein